MFASFKTTICSKRTTDKLTKQKYIIHLHSYANTKNIEYLFFTVSIRNKDVVTQEKVKFG
jgi:hypothetical protein